MTEKQIKLLRYFEKYGEESIPYHLRLESVWARRLGYLENTRQTTGIANTIGGVQWIYVLTDTGKAALAQEGAQP